MKKSFKLFALTALSLMLSIATFAQVTTASISGKISEQTGPMVGATVKATHKPTGTVYYAITQSNGRYNIANMRIGGPYDVEVSYIGFNPEVFKDFSLSLGEEKTINVTMKEDSQKLDELLVVAEASQVMSKNRTGNQEIITRDQMDKLPTLNRSLSDFTKLSPLSSGSSFGGVSYRFNNVTVDGASFNNSFGLSSSLGASGTEPISLEALDQVQVMIAPFDVRNGGFTGAGINSVTKSGTNEWHASAYMYIKSPSLRGYQQKDEIASVTDFSNKQYGVSLSGPIIPNKLFFFINGELDRQENPVNYTTANSRVEASKLQDLSNFLNDKLGYDPGKFDVNKMNTQADRITARLDWNINRSNVLSLKYFYLKSFNDNNPSSSGAPANGRGPNQYAIPFSSAFYKTNNNFNIVMADLSTTINDRMSNYLKVGYSRLRDFRSMDGGFFPQVDILELNKQSNALESYSCFGTEANSYNNKLNTDIFQIQDNFVMNFGKHQLTVGTQSDYRSFKNGFAQNYTGSWVFNSIDDFKFNVLATQDYLKSNGNSMSGFDITKFDPTKYGFDSSVTGITNTGRTGQTRYRQKYALTDDFPFAEVNVLQLGFYVQDRWNINDKLNLTLGLRVDTPIFMTDLAENPNVAAETYRDGITVDVSKYPNARPQFSPRLGFNWKPLDNGSLQVRGGTGIFSGTPPYVWLSNQAGNNGVLFGDIEYKDAALKNLGFTGNMNEYRPKDGAATRADIAVTDPDFKYPTLWKTNLAVDYKWGNGWVATVELLYSKDINAIYHDNIGLVEAGKNVNDGSKASERRAFTGTYYSDQAGNKKAANNVVLLRNTNKGYSIYTTLQLQKNFYQGAFKGLNLNGSYSFGTAKSVTDGTSHVATSAWKYRPAINSNDQELGYSASAFDGRLLLSASYTANWGKHSSTNIGVVYQRYRPFRYSYCYNGDANGDSQTANDLMYIPRDFSEVEGHLVADGFSSVENAWQAMNNFIEQDPYLSKHRGEYAERNGAFAPFANQLDLSISQDIKIFQSNGRYHTIRLSFDIQNFLNMLCKDWGVQQTTILGNQQYQFLTVTKDGKPNASNDYNLKYSMNKTLTDTYKDYVGTSSRWVAQFGIKYIF